MVDAVKMYCPRCGQERVSEATRFCSRCGYLLTGTADLLQMGGSLPEMPRAGEDSPRRRGVKQGIFLFLLTFVIAPIVGLIATFVLRMQPWPVGLVVFLLGFGGLLRIAYAMMFESKYSPTSAGVSAGALPSDPAKLSLPEPTTRGAWSEVETAFVPPDPALAPRPFTSGSVTESTTKLLDKDDR